MTVERWVGLVIGENSTVIKKLHFEIKSVTIEHFVVKFQLGRCNRCGYTYSNTWTEMHHIIVKYTTCSISLFMGCR